jgi:hypothetical protein
MNLFVSILCIIHLFVVVVGLYNVTYPKQVDTNKQHDNNNNDNNTIRNEKDDYDNAMKLLNTIDEEIATTTTTAIGDVQKCPFMHSVKKTKNQVSGQGKHRNPTTAYTAPWENDENDDKSRSLLSSSSSSTTTAKKCHDKHCNHCDDDDIYESDYDMEYVQSKENNYSEHYFLDSDHENSRNSRSSSRSSSSSSSRGSSSGNNGISSSNGTRNIQVVKANKSQSSTFSIIDADERV